LAPGGPVCPLGVNWLMEVLKSIDLLQKELQNTFFSTLGMRPYDNNFSKKILPNACMVMSLEQLTSGHT
jgi:hypothetical protein